MKYHNHKVTFWAYLLIALATAALFRCRAQGLIIDPYRFAAAASLAVARSGGSGVWSSSVSTFSPVSSFQVDGSNKLLILQVYYSSSGGSTISSVKWDSLGVNESLTSQHSIGTPVDGHHSVWALVAPTAATSDVKITFSGNVETVVGIVTLVTGANQVSPFSAFTSFDDVGDTTLTLTITTAANSLPMGVCRSGSVSLQASAPGNSYRQVDNGETLPLLDAATTTRSGATTDLTWTQSSSTAMTGIGWSVNAP